MTQYLINGSSKRNLPPQKKRIKWTKNEIILACDVLARHQWSELKADHPAIVELSRYLRSLVSDDYLESNPKYRNPAGVSRKTTDLLTAHPDYIGVTTKGGKETLQVVKEYLLNPDRIRKQALWLSRDQQGRDAIISDLAPN